MAAFSRTTGSDIVGNCAIAKRLTRPSTASTLRSSLRSDQCYSNRIRVQSEECATFVIENIVGDYFQPKKPTDSTFWHTTFTLRKTSFISINFNLIYSNVRRMSMS
ncbi:hypothetical protein Zm00014a_023972 [Zea mays]|uniref:Uncharacterized protein n=2 Tax=Zea mays TaxID=4577 RepID=A0A8J8XL64_MAIZE|nr:hypothetical protein ZEAMMB73_Zm00001d014574 [Zea mays]PWZ19911.1 hypothetical protein Zm00014a_023972 [Zea mays]